MRGLTGREQHDAVSCNVSRRSWRRRCRYRASIDDDHNSQGAFEIVFPHDSGGIPSQIGLYFSARCSDDVRRARIERRPRALSLE